MISVFAFTVVLATAPMAMAFRKVGRKTLVVASLAVVSLANLGVALSPGLEWMLAIRILGAMAHGLFWAVVATYAVEIVPREKLGRAMAYTAAGGAMAGILGIPIGNVLGELFGWRLAFAAVAVSGVAISLVLWRWLPRIDSKSVTVTTNGRRNSWDRSALGILVVCLLILVLVLAQTSFGPYTTLWLEEVARMDRAVVPVYLLTTGGAGAVGAVVAGHLYDRSPRATFVGSIAVLAAALCCFPFAAGGGFGVTLVVVAVVSSVAFAGLPTMLQARMMHTASPQMRRAAGTAQTIVFNVAIGGGAVVGGLVVSGPGVAALPWLAAAGVVLTGCMALVWEYTLARRTSDANVVLAADAGSGSSD